MTRKKRKPLTLPPVPPALPSVRLRMLADLLAWVADQLRKLADAPR